MKPFLTTVTVTGADDSFPLPRMLDLSERYPFVEWGILLSKASTGNPRFPSMAWLSALRDAQQHHPGLRLRLSAHLCGRWVRDFCAGDTSGLMVDLGRATNDLSMFSRVQLNFHNIAHKVDVNAMVRAMKQLPHVQFILQLDGVNDHILDEVLKHGVNAVGLFDLSGGNGVLPEDWPVRIAYAGYAGGLSASNVALQLHDIADAAKGGAWIDAESRLRSDDDRALLPHLVETFLSEAAPWVVK